MSKGKDSSPAETAGGEEFSVEKVLDRRVVKGKVCNFNIYIHTHIEYLKIIIQIYNIFSLFNNNKFNFLDFYIIFF